MKIERHDVAARMSKVVVHGDTVYLAGIVADNPKGKSVTEQTKSILVGRSTASWPKPEPTRPNCCRRISGSPTWPISPR